MFGKSELTTSGHLAHHGDPHEGFRFHVHPRKPNFRKAGIVIWRPGRDTLCCAAEYCTAAEFVRRLGNGTAIWRCKGHELDKTSVALDPVFPVAF